MTEKLGNKILVFGASGYVGSRLIPLLLSKGYCVRAVSRLAESIQKRVWASHPRVEIFPGNILDFDFVKRACEGCQAAYYLIHSMYPTNTDFAKVDRSAALNMTRAAKETALPRIIYLGGLGDAKAPLSKHLRSRAEVAGILYNGRSPATILRAAIIIGCGSASFEILRSVINKLPIVLTSPWVATLSQPIAIRNVLNYLIGCLDNPLTIGKILDIGGSDVISYRDLIQIYMEEAKLGKRLIVSSPLISSRMAIFLVRWLTDVPSSISRPLMEGLKNEALCQDSRIREMIPQPIFSCREAIQRALNTEAQSIEMVLEGNLRIPPPEVYQPGDLLRSNLGRNF